MLGKERPFYRRGLLCSTLGSMWTGHAWGDTKSSTMDIQTCIGHAGVGTKLKEWQLSNDDKCPWCGDCEDTHHIWLCQLLDARWLCSIKFAHLQQWMKDNKTAPELQHALTKRLTTWSLDTPLCPLVTSSLMINTAILSQDEIGWTNFFEGCLER